MEFKQSVITQQGRNLMAKLLAGNRTTVFTRLVTSTKIYTDLQLRSLTSIAEIKQSTTVQARVNNSSTVTVEGSIANTGLTAGYDVNTIGLYAKDPDLGEILYSVAGAKVNGYVPADNGISKTGLLIKIYTEVGNADQVTLTVEPGAVATKGDIAEINQRIDLSVIGGVYALNLSGLSNDDFPQFRAYVYQYGAGIPQPDPGYFGVRQTNAVPLQPQFTNSNNSVQFLFNAAQIQHYLANFVKASITTSFSADRHWLYLTSGVSTIGIRADNVTFK